jgi:PIN domain nuclease of toxin-antitoxin system
LSVLLDTHVWLWWLTGQSSLPERERISLDLAAARQELCLSAISLWEAQMLHAKRRVELPLPFAEWLRRAAAPGVVRVLALATHDERIRRASCGPREYQVAAEGCPPIT